MIRINVLNKQTKKCSKCKVYKDIFLFYRNKSKYDGLSTECKECSTNSRKEYFRLYSVKYRDDNIKYQKQYYKNNKQWVLQRCKEYYIDNIEKRKEYNKNNLDIRNQKQKKKRKENIVVKLRHNVACSVRQHLFNKFSTKNSPTWFKLPYSPQDLKDHLENQFEPWMNWENYGLGEGKWNIDHIIPQSKLLYDSMDHPNFQKCWALENLRPLEANENMRKGNKII